MRAEWDKGAEVEIATAPVLPVSPSLLAMHFLASEAVFPELGKLKHQRQCTTGLF